MCLVFKELQNDKQNLSNFFATLVSQRFFLAFSYLKSSRMNFFATLVSQEFFLAYSSMLLESQAGL